MDLIKVDITQYGLDETKAAEVKKDFDAVLKIAVELEDEFNRVTALPITKAVCAEAKALRLKYVKVRTAIAAVHKERKAFYLSGGRAVDGLKNAYTHAVEGNEERLGAIENYFENIEKARIAELQRTRETALQKFAPEYAPSDLGAMPEEIWSTYLAGAEASHLKRLKDAEDAEKRARTEAEERERIRIENARLRAEAEEREKALRAETELRIKREKDAADTAKREADVSHRSRIYTATKELFMSYGLSEDKSRELVKAIAKNEVANVRFLY